MDLILLALKELYEKAISETGSPIGDIKAVYNGEPSKIPESDCPALILKPIGTRYRPGGPGGSGSQVDVRDVAFQAILVLPRKRFYASSYDVPAAESVETAPGNIREGDARKVYVEAKAAEMTEDMDSAQRAGENSIVGVVQNNPTLPYSGGTASSNALIEGVEYDTRPTAPRGFSSYEVTVTGRATVRGNRRPTS